MKNLIRKSFLEYLIKYRNGYLALASGSLLLNLLFCISFIMMIGRERIIIVPPEISKTFWVSKNSVSNEYLSEMSMFFISLRFNLTPSNVEEQREILLRYICPEFYSTLKTQLINEGERIRNQNINTVFYPVDIKVNVKNFTTFITGDLVSSISGNIIPNKRLIYKISYKYNFGRLLVKSFEEVKND